MTAPAPPVALVDLAAQRRRLGGRLDAAIERVLDHGRFIMGPEVAELEHRLAAYSGAVHAIGCASGTDALLLALMTLGVGPGDAVVVPSFTFAATAEVVALLGATPVFVDVTADTFTVDPTSLTKAIDLVDGAAHLTARAVVTVDLFGQPADYDAIEPLCAERGLTLLVDAAQSFGSTWQGRRAGSIGAIATTSFFPSKPLGCYGDGGAVFTSDDELAATVRSLRVHGQGTGKYDNVRVGINGRLDTLQAAILLEKLAIFDEEIAARERVAARYEEGLADVVTVPPVAPQATSAWAQYTVLVERRDAMVARLAARGVSTAVYYPRPLHRQPAYTDCPTAPDGLPVSDDLAARVLSLPMHPYLDETAQRRVIDAMREAVT